MRLAVRSAAWLASFAAAWCVCLVVLALSGQPVPYHQRLNRVPGLQALHRHLHPAATAAAPAVDLRLMAPPRLYAVPGVETSLYFDNLVLTRQPDLLQFQVQCYIGQVERRRWVVVPSAANVGEYAVRITVTDLNGKELAQAETTLCVTPVDAGAHGGADGSLRMLVVGDCWIHQTDMLNELGQMLTGPRQPDWEMLGTHVLPIALPKVRHEGYGGWGWNDFLAYNKPGNTKRYRERSPFLFPDAAGAVRLDVPRYFREVCDNRPPQLTIFELGGNEAFEGDPDRPAALDALLDQVLKDADTLVAAFRAAAPGMAIGIVVPPQLSASDSDFRHVYGLAYPRWKVRQNFHRYQERLHAHFAGQEKNGIYLIPTFANLDAVDGYAVGSSAALTRLGRQQFATSLYTWIKHWQARPRPHAASAVAGPAGRG